MGLLLLATVYSFLRFESTSERSWLASAALAFGLLVFTKLINVMFLPVFVLFLAWPSFGGPRLARTACGAGDAARVAALFLLPVFPFSSFRVSTAGCVTVLRLSAAPEGGRTVHHLSELVRRAILRQASPACSSAPSAASFCILRLCCCLSRRSSCSSAPPHGHCFVSRVAAVSVLVTAARRDWDGHLVGRRRYQCL